MASQLTDKLRSMANKESTPKTLIHVVKQELLSLFSDITPPSIKETPHVILIVGINGSGKTTSVAKLASHFQQSGKTVLIGAADTFRAAAVEQLSLWANKLQIPIVKSQMGSDPSSVAFDTISSAKAKGIDIVIIDTAGRLQTKTDLMHELNKMRRSIQKQIPDAPHETLFVLDATGGQNGIDQARTFNQFTPITGIILTKLDGSAKGGIGIAIQKELKTPILWVGTGEGEEDLSPFKPESYIDAILGISENR
jgi:fused signal recognition particle receptor